MYSGCGSTIASHLSTAARYVSEGRSFRPGWDGIASFLIEPNFGDGHLDDQNQGAPINNLDWRSTLFANCIHWDCRPTSRSVRSRDRRLQRPNRDTAHPSVCGRRSGPLTGYQNVAPHESNLPYLRRIKAAFRPRAQQSAGGAKYVWNDLVRSRQRRPSIDLAWRTTTRRIVTFKQRGCRLRLLPLCLLVWRIWIQQNCPT
jgi:hypothetical protein